MKETDNSSPSVQPARLLDASFYFYMDVDLRDNLLAFAHSLQEQGLPATFMDVGDGTCIIKIGRIEWKPVQ